MDLLIKNDVTEMIFVDLEPEGMPFEVPLGSTMRISYDDHLNEVEVIYAAVNCIEIHVMTSYVVYIDGKFVHRFP